MRFSILCSLLAVVGWTSAGPILARQASQNDIDPGLVFTAVLESGAASYFSLILDTFDDQAFEDAGFSSAVIRNEVITTIAENEADHLTVVLDALGSPPPNCTLDFTPAFVDVATALRVARELDTIAMGHYIGVIASEPESHFIELFAEILSNEAQHTSILNFATANQPTTLAFDMGLTSLEVLALLSPFNPSCNPSLGITPNTPLVITNNEIITNHTTLTFDLSGTPCASQTGLSCQILNGNDATSTVHPIDECTMNGKAGANYIYVTTDGFPLSADPLDRVNTPNLCAGPALLLIDN